ncbi:hypothetical protein [Arthrobacter sp. Leaf69]|uniref:hypothetical protein n=1 Tax=Arthrobacter sp. Leaf69 TaxID=1736232 RepID=UPI0006F93EAE|nr:hypothetical protein ASE96_06680 [Arthrobacter sp. Leaf69]
MGRHDNSGTRGSRPGASGSGATAGRSTAGNSVRKPARKPTGKPARKPAQKPARKPVSPVYRRRRLFVGAALLLVIALAIGGFAAVSSLLNSGQSSSGGGTGAPGQATGPAAGPGPSASPTASPSASPEGNGCEQNLVTVTAATDKPAYAAGENPLLTLKVTNGNRVPCKVNIGTSQMEFLVTSGSDRIFSSTDCQADSTDLVKTIAPGQSETANFPWQRNRTVQGCAQIDAKPGAGGAYYVFTARLANKTSPKAVFQLN